VAGIATTTTTMATTATTVAAIASAADGVLHEGSHRGTVALVTWFVSDDVRADARPSENEITDTIECLVPSELIGPTERVVHDAVGAEHHRVARGCPLNQSFRA
jgi:hypothetical protein